MTTLDQRTEIEIITDQPKVFKYVLGLRSDPTTLMMPRDSEILCAHEQSGNVCIWARVVNSRVSEPRNFILCGTGHDAPDLDHRYIGTAILHGGVLVLHVFEVPR